MTKRSVVVPFAGSGSRTAWKVGEARGCAGVPAQELPSSDEMAGPERVLYMYDHQVPAAKRAVELASGDYKYRVLPHWANFHDGTGAYETHWDRLNKLVRSR